MPVELLIAISNLVQGQQITIHVDDANRYVFKLITNFGQEAKPFWIVSQHSMHMIKYHFEKGDADEVLADIIDNLIAGMDEALINHEPETY